MTPERRAGHHASAWCVMLAGAGFSMTLAMANPEREAPSTPATSSHPTLPDAPELRLVVQHCLACHNLTRIENAGGSRSGWTKRIKRMITRGSTLPPQDVPAVAEYLARALPERLRPAMPTDVSSSTP